MEEGPGNGSVGMKRGSMLRVDDGRGTLIHVWKGEVWLTQEGSAKDHILSTGQSFRLDRNGAAIVYAFHRSVVSLSAPVADSTGWRRVWAALLAPLSRPAARTASTH